MKKQYTEFLSLALLHRFYESGAARDLTLRPDPATVQQIRNLELLWRNTGPGSFALCFGNASNNPAPLSLLDNAMVNLRFTMHSSDPYFMNMTELPLPEFDSNGQATERVGIQQRLYFSHPNPFPGPDYDPSFLSKMPVVGADDLFPVRPVEFTFKSPTSEVLSIRDCLGAPLSKGENPLWTPLQPKQEGEKSDTFKINLQDCPIGKYGIETAPGKIEWFVLEPNTPQTPILGIVDLFIGQGDYALTPPDQNPDIPFVPHKFSIQFEARATHWRYFLIPNNPFQFERMEITDGNFPLPFTIDGVDIAEVSFTVDDTGWQYLLPQKDKAEVGVELQGGGQKAIPLTSTQAIKLQERPQIMPTLRLLQKNGNAHATVVSLPVPDWRQVTPERNDSILKLYSDMYVYL